MDARLHSCAAALVMGALVLCSACAPVAPRQSPPAASVPATTTVPTPGPWPRVALETAWQGLDTPVALTSARDGSDRVFIVEKKGRIRLAKGGVLLARPFLDIHGLVSGGGEQGLLGIAFPPKYSSLRHFYVYYTDLSGDIHIARVGLTADPDVADPGSLRTVLKIAHPSYANHNGGQLAFGPDGYLYAGIGDGGSAGDPKDNAQNLGELKGKLLRIDVGSDATYSVPSSNPFAGRAGARPEVWAYGLRNPWRFSFDRLDGTLWIGDVGQDAWEEVDVQPADSPGGQNYGWRRYEGTHPYPPGSAASPTAGLTFPIDEYDHSFGESVIGGYVYRGVAQPALRGIYLYADWWGGQLLGLRRNGDAWERVVLIETGRHPTSFGEDDAGEVYMCDEAGAVLRIVESK